MGANSELYTKIQDEIINTIHEVEEGNIGYLDGLIILEDERKHLENSIAMIRDFKDDNFQEIENESSDYPEGYKGYKVEIRNGGQSFSYKKIPEWQKVEKQKKEVESRYKAMFEAKEKGLLHANISEEGEELPLPEVKYRKSSIILKKKK